MSQNGALDDHYRNPRNLGELDHPDAVALVHNPACGDMLRLAVTVDSGHFTAVRFKAYGCAAAIAASSVATELIDGATIGQAALITDADIVEVLGPLPPMKVHAIVLAREGIRQIVDRLRQQGTD